MCNWVLELETGKREIVRSENEIEKLIQTFPSRMWTLRYIFRVLELFLQQPRVAKELNDGNDVREDMEWIFYELYPSFFIFRTFLCKVLKMFLCCQLFLRMERKRTEPESVNVYSPTSLSHSDVEVRKKKGTGLIRTGRTFSELLRNEEFSFLAL